MKASGGKYTWFNFLCFLTDWIFMEMWIISIVNIDRLINGWVELNCHQKNF